jgi:hypothetical protein
MYYTSAVKAHSNQKGVMGSTDSSLQKMNKYFRTNYFTVINRKYTRVLYMYAVPIHVCSTYSTYIQVQVKIKSTSTSTSTSTYIAITSWKRKI